MKRTIYATLAGLILAAIAASPVAALTQRFEEAREATLNKVSDPSEEVTKNATQTKLTQRFEDERRETLNR